MTRNLALCVAVAATGSGCTFFHETVLHETSWQKAAFFEVSREKVGLQLQVQEEGGETWLSVVEKWECLEEATQDGVEIEERKPKDWVLGVGAAAGGGLTASAIGVFGGWLTSKMVDETRTGSQNGVSQIVGVGVGIAGMVGQLLLFKQIVKGLNEIRYVRERPRRQELGRKVMCEEKPMTGVLQGPGLPDEGVTLSPRGHPPKDFVFDPQSTFTLDGVPVQVAPF